MHITFTNSTKDSSGKYWSEDELDEIEQAMPEYTGIFRILNRSAIMPRMRPKWTPQKRLKLLLNSHKSLTELEKLFPDHSRSSISRVHANLMRDADKAMCYSAGM